MSEITHEYARQMLHAMPMRDTAIDVLQVYVNQQENNSKFTAELHESNFRQGAKINEIEGWRIQFANDLMTMLGYQPGSAEADALNIREEIKRQLSERKLLHDKIRNLERDILERDREITTLKIPDMFWDWDDSEQMIDGGLDEFFANNNAGDGAIFRMECAQRLPDQYYIIEYPSNGEVGNYRDCTPEEIAEYKRRKEERKST